jgi:tetratricopeptide (TPR) repeat protein
LALLQLKANQDEAAEANFKKVIELNPKETRARILLGSYYQSHSRPADAEQEFREAIAADPTDMAPREALAKFYLSERKMSDAENTLEQAKRDLPHNPDCLLALSNFYFAKGNLDKAVAEYTALYLEHPTDITTKKKFIQLLIQTRQFDEARKLDEEILKANPNDNDALVYRSEIQISEGDVNDAAHTLQTVVSNSPSDSQAHYALGVALNRQGYPERAESEWRQALRLNPNLLDAQRGIADQAILKGDMNALQDAANQMIRLEPESAEGYAIRALSSMNRGQFDAAERDVRRAIEAAPQNAIGYVQTGNLKLAEKQYADAAKAYQDALDRNSNSTDALRGLMDTYIAEKQPEKAIAAAKTQINKSPANSSFYNLLGTTLFHFVKDLNGAEAALDKAVALDGHNSDAVIQLCEVRATKGQVDQAIATGEQALQQNPRKADLYLLLGDLYEAKSDWKSAENAYQSVLAMNSLNPVASNDLARVMLHTGGSLDVALSLAQTARRGLQQSPIVADTVGWIYYQRGEYQLALYFLQQALTLQQKNHMPDNPDIHYHLGMTYEKTKQSGLARQNFEQVLKTNPNYRSASEVKAELVRLKS